ncbi:beta-L-arabinofuranosidase domain-containing protein [Paenibacillus psychroresistens]|nr:beta-L-arabinofuranosidase domain-containing protein [Paenibacillus psychroresistens]
MKTIDIRSIEVGGEIGRRIDITAKNNILAIDIQRDFIQPFRDKWDKDKELGDYVGLGKFIDALTRLAAYKQDEELTNLRDSVINQILALQEQNGYIGIMPLDYRFNRLWDIHEISYMIFGLVSDYRYWKEVKSLAAACRLADYLMEQWKAAPQDLPEIYIGTLGSEEAFLALYEQTQDQRYLEFLTEFRKFQDWDRPIVKGRLEHVDGHIYDYLSRLIARFKLSKCLNVPALLATIHQTVDFMLNQDAMVITGAAGENECWQDTQEGLGNLGETCATAYWIRLLDILLQETSNSLYGDVMERTIFNGLFAAQSPDGRKIRYYVPFDGPKRYFPLDTYCCPNNFRRIISELPEMIYYRTVDGVAINLYTASKATIDLDNNTSVTIRQETDYPHSGQIHIAIDPSMSVRFVLKLRIPKWCAGAGTQVKVNHQTITTSASAGSFFEIERLWSAGDAIELNLPMGYRLIKGRKAQKGRAAVMKGPIVFCFNPSQNTEITRSDMRLIAFDPSLVESMDSKDVMHPNGHACCIKAWGPYKHAPENSPELKLYLTDFADPDGEFVYFRVVDENAGNLVEDELTQLELGRREEVAK